jgi:hypothetical protein
MINKNILKFRKKSFFLTCLVTVILAFVLFFGASCSAIPGADECNAIVDNFMKAAAQKDVDTAYSLCVEEMAWEDIESLVLEDNQFFAGYQNIKMKGINVEYEDNRSYAEYEGEAYYSGDIIRSVEAELILRGENWEIVSIYVSL